MQQLFFYAATCKRAYFYVVLQWASNNNYIFFVMSWGSKQQYKQFEHQEKWGIAVWLWNATINFLYAVDCKKWQQRVYLYVILWEKQRLLYFWCCKKWSYCKRNQNKLTITRGEDTTIKFLICCWLQGWRQWLYFFQSSTRSNNNGWLQQRSMWDCTTTTNLFHQCGLTTSTIAMAWSASNYIDCNAMTTMLTTRQSFFTVTMQGVLTITDKCKGRTKWLPRNNQIFMLSFTEWDNNHIAQCNNQQRKYAKVKYGK